MIISSLGLAKKDCKLRNGNYRIVYTGHFAHFGQADLTIRNGKYLIVRDSNQTIFRELVEKGNLVVEGDCYYSFRYKDYGQGLFKLRPKMAIDSVSGDTLYFSVGSIQNCVEATGTIVKKR